MPEEMGILSRAFGENVAMPTHQFHVFKFQNCEQISFCRFKSREFVVMFSQQPKINSAYCKRTGKQASRVPCEASDSQALGSYTEQAVR